MRRFRNRRQLNYRSLLSWRISVHFPAFHQWRCQRRVRAGPGPSRRRRPASRDQAGRAGRVKRTVFALEAARPVCSAERRATATAGRGQARWGSPPSRSPKFPAGGMGLIFIAPVAGPGQRGRRRKNQIDQPGDHRRARGLPGDEGQDQQGQQPGCRARAAAAVAVRAGSGPGPASSPATRPWPASVPVPAAGAGTWGPVGGQVGVGLGPAPGGAELGVGGGGGGVVGDVAAVGPVGVGVGGDGPPRRPDLSVAQVRADREPQRLERVHRAPPGRRCHRSALVRWRVVLLGSGGGAGGGMMTDGTRAAGSDSGDGLGRATWTKVAPPWWM